MKKYSLYIIAISFAAFIAGCKSISAYTIDEHPLVKTDSALFGIWKAAEDTDKANYILIQSPYDVFHYTDWWYHLDSVKKRSYFDEQFLADPERVRMAFHKDETMLNEAYREFIEKKDHYYYITRMDNHGRNPKYEQWATFLSKVSTATFLNIPYRYVPPSGHTGEHIRVGYFFVRLVNVSKSNDTITTAIISDPSLESLASSREVRNHVAKNVHNPTFYSDTLHFYKVSSYHLSLEESKQKANP